MDDSDHAAKRRKIRKGTRSCWECRRRKIKCQFTHDDDDICVPCQSRGADCVSQEFATEPAPATHPRLSQRLGRLEAMMEKLVDRATVDTSPQSMSPPEHPQRQRQRHHQTSKMPSPSDSSASSTTPAFDAHAMDLLDSSAASHAQTVTSVMAHDVDMENCPRPPSPFGRRKRAASLSSRPWHAKYGHISQQLHALFPPVDFLSAVAEHLTGARSVLAIFYSHQEQVANKPAHASALTTVPDVTSHPAVLARRLLQLAICLQQPEDAEMLGCATPANACPYRFLPELPRPIPETVQSWVAAVAELVTSNDDLMGCQEGIECLVLLSCYLSDAGHLRKAWVTSRRALAMGQLLGLDRLPAPARCPTRIPLRSVDIAVDPSRRPGPAMLWFRINCGDRYLSLLLGLPVGSRDDAFADEEQMHSDGPHDRLGKMYIVIAGRIAARNETAASLKPGSANDAYALTQSLDMDLEKAARMMSEIWWRVPSLSQPAASLPTTSGAPTPSSWPGLPSVADAASDRPMPGATAMKIQVRHYSLLIIAHLPYLLRAREEPRYEYNRATCMRASRAVLERFLEFRRAFTSPVSGRFVDYAALIAAMTLLLGHLGRRKGDGKERGGDRVLVSMVRATMRAMGTEFADRLSSESADTIGELLPIVEDGAPAREPAKNVHLNIPFLGTVNINSQADTPGGTVPPSDKPSQDTTSPDFTSQQLSGEYSMPSAPFSFSLDPTLSHVPPPGDAMPGDEGLDFPSMGWPDMAANVDDWALQGVDTTYWSMVNTISPDQ